MQRAFTRHVGEHQLGDRVVGQALRVEDQQGDELTGAVYLAAGFADQLPIPVQHERPEELNFEAWERVFDDHAYLGRRTDAGPRPAGRRQSFDFGEQDRVHPELAAGAQQARILGSRSGQQCW